MPPTRILYVTDLLLAGGIERQLTELVIRLDRSRFEPHILCLYGPRTGRSLHFAEQLQAANIPVHVLDLTPSPAAKLRGLLLIAWETWKLHPHVLHAVNYHSNLLSRLARLMLPPRTRLLGSLRTEATAKQLLYERVSGWACWRIVCNSPHLQRQLIDQAHISASKVDYIPNGIDTDRFASSPDPALSQQLRTNASAVLAMFGRISEQKSPYLLAQAVGLLTEQGQWPANARVLIVGERESVVQQTWLEAAISHHGLSAIVEQFPQTSQPQTFYHAADFTVLASLWEGLPNVALESLAAGRPVIISEAANAAEVITQGVTGWIVKTGDVESLANAIRTALNTSPEAMSTMRIACVARAGDFAMAKMVAAYESLYARL